MASTSVGITRNQSVIRMMTVAYQPLKCPAVIPTIVPMATESKAASSPTVSDTRAPHTSRPSRLRPNWSVPRGNSPLGDSMRLARRVGHALRVRADEQRREAGDEGDQRRARPGRQSPARWVRYSRQKRAAEWRLRVQASARGLFGGRRRRSRLSDRSSSAHPGIEQRIDHVGEGVHQDHRGGEDEEQTLHQRQIGHAQRR